MPPRRRPQRAGSRRASVTLEGDLTQARRDRYNRLLAYVRLPGGRDLGAQLIRGGFGEV